ncbi:MAG: prepilin-type N-terminal cleavage/methylation domain-containing protein [Akkermansia sp.]|nr:prepilin-type N-terminal cleavage/methylation domain-containing protein [Akkermansia sp.]MBR2313731.1 prepilin-type N-terminal cleavage/methylation domain-containing protein [Akkermansia sp.]
MKLGKKSLYRGFTLIELMTAMAITGMLVVVIMQLTNQSIDLWRAVSEDVSTSTRSRAALQTLSHDFESFQMRGYDNKYQWLFAKADESMDNVPKGLSIPRSAQCVFFACAPDRNPSVSSSTSLRKNYREARAHNRDTQGDVNAIGYRLMYRDQIQNLPGVEGDEPGVYPLFSLYRQVVSPRDSFEQLLGKENLESAYVRFEDDDEKNFLCENIMELNITFNIRYASSQADAKEGRVEYEVVSVPIVASNRRTNKVAVYGDRIVAGGSTYENARIDSAMLSITVLTEEGAAMVEQIRQGRRRPPRKIADFFAKYTRSYSRLVSVPQPL